MFPKHIDPTGKSYPFFKDYEKCFKTGRGLEEETTQIQTQTNLLYSNLYKFIKPSFKGTDYIQFEPECIFVFNLLNLSRR